MLNACTPGQRRRLNRALDDLTVRWAVNALPATCRWLLNTQAIFLRKDREPTCKDFDDDEWLDWISNGDMHWDRDVAEEDVIDVGDELEADDPMGEPHDCAASREEGGAGGGVDRCEHDGEQRTTAARVSTIHSRNVGAQPMDTDDARGSAAPKVRPIQIGEWLRRWVSRRLLKINKADIECVTGAMRQLGVGTPGGAEALAIFQQCLHDLWRAGGVETPLARIKIDERNCFGMLEWSAVRDATCAALPRHFPVACWKHAATSYVEQNGVEATSKDRGAEQGDVDGPLECSLAMGKISSLSRHAVHEKQRRGELPWIGAASGEQLQAAQYDFDQRRIRHRAWTETTPSGRRSDSGDKAIIPDPAHEIQAFGGIADFWYLDDGDIICHPELVLAILQSHDNADAAAGGSRNLSKSEVLYFVDEATLAAHTSDWHLAEVGALADVKCAENHGLTLGVATGDLDAIERQLERKTEVVKAIQERIATVNDVQTEHVLNRDSLGVCRVNHILRVHGTTLHRENSAALRQFDESGRREKDRLFPGLTEESHIQASLSDAYGGLGWRKASEVALPANLAALIMSAPKIKHMAGQASLAGLLQTGRLEDVFAAKLEEAQRLYLQRLDESDRLKAVGFLEKARQAAAEQWTRAMSGNSAAVDVPSVNTRFDGDGDDVAHTGSVQSEGDASASTHNSRHGVTTPKVQKILSRLFDCTKLRALEAQLTRQCNWTQLDRLKDLRHPEVSHKWIRHLDSCRGSVLPQCDYLLAVQKRLGARIYEGDAQCRLCGRSLDPFLEHSECCATAEATRGHYACVRALVRGIRLADPSVTTEPRGLTNTSSRPADILTAAAVPGRSAALDVCVTSPNSAGAAGDAAATAFARKLRRYWREIPQLRAAGIVYRPLVWTADGRPHPAVSRTLAFAADIAVHRSDRAVEAHALLARWRHEIQIALQQRRAAMARAVLPRMSLSDNFMLSGHVASSPSSHFRLDTLEPQSNVQTESGNRARDHEYEALRTHPPPGVSPEAAALTYASRVGEDDDLVAMRIDAPPGLGNMDLEDSETGVGDTN